MVTNTQTAKKVVVVRVKHKDDLPLVILPATNHTRAVIIEAFKAGCRVLMESDYLNSLDVRTVGGAMNACAARKAMRSWAMENFGERYGPFVLIRRQPRAGNRTILQD